MRARSGSKTEKAGNDELFDEEFQRRLEYLAIASRKAYSGRMRAERKSKKTGAGIEFADHREYVAGDDFRYLDVNVYQRTGRLLVRLFEEEEDLSVYIIVDTSASMGIDGGQKLRYAKRIAAALGYVALANLDRVSILSFQDQMDGRLAPTRGKKRIFKLFDFLRPLTANGETKMRTSLRTFVAQNKRRGVAILISDLYDQEGFEDGINQLRYAKFEPYVLQLFDPKELEPDLHGDVRLVDHETGDYREVTITPGVLKKYRQAHERYRKTIEDFCRQKQVAYHALSTDVPFDEAILQVLRAGGLVR